MTTAARRSDDEMRANFEAAHEWVSDLCSGKRRWRMRVPVDASDSDIVLSTAITDGESLLAKVEMLKAGFRCVEPCSCPTHCPPYDEQVDCDPPCCYAAAVRQRDAAVAAGAPEAPA